MNRMAAPAAGAMDEAPSPGAALPRPALARLLRDGQADLADYAVLDGLLEQQFHCALRHDGSQMDALAQRILEVVERLDERRGVRRALAERLLGPGAPGGMAALSARLPASQRDAVQALWERLELAVRGSKARNARNARLMTEQQGMLQRVLHGAEEPLYEGAHAAP